MAFIGTLEIQEPQGFMETGLQVRPLVEDRDQDVNQDGGPDLRHAPLYEVPKKALNRRCCLFDLKKSPTCRRAVKITAHCIRGMKAPNSHCWRQYRGRLAQEGDHDA